VVPRTVERRAPVKVASSAAVVLRPVIRLLGSVQRLLTAAGLALTPGQGGGTG